MKLENIEKLSHLQSENFFLIAGPCVVEQENVDFLMNIALKIKQITDKLQIPFVFKASFKKANRSRIDSFMGIGDQKALELIKQVGKELSVPTITDIHSEQDAQMAKDFVDILQIPAFLARQTDLLVAAAKTSKVVNIKKGQFMSAESMEFAVQKVKDSGNQNVMVTDRGTFFGYQDLVVDFRGIPVMKNFATTVLDITHSLQRPNQTCGVTSGMPQMIETIARAGIACGVDGLFLETHPNPQKAKSDGANMLQLDKLEDLLFNLVQIRKVINQINK